MDDHVRPADGDARDGAGVPAHDDGALVHVVREAPADVAVDLEPGQVGEPAAEVAGRPVHPHRDGVGQADTDVVAGIGVDDVDVLALLAVGEQELVGVGDGDLR